MTPRLQLTGITKAYPGVVANRNIALTVQPGEIHAVLGENGAGKSTLMQIIYGAIRPDAGELRFNGLALHSHSPRQARAHGIHMVFQHFKLFDSMSVAHNVWLGLGGWSLAQVTASIRAKSVEYGLELDPARPVHTLSVGEMQRVELMRALLTQPQLLILDEPTSVLTPQAVEKLFVVLQRLASQGCSILYISHKLHEIRHLCTTCTVLRAGEVRGVCNPQQESNASLSRLMLGAEPPPLVHRPQTPGPTVLQVAGLTLARAAQFGVDLHDIDLHVRAGEVLGIAGVSGNGQQELLAALSGEDPRAPPGSIRLDGTDVSRLPPGARRALGLHAVPEERLGHGAVPAMSLAHNLLLTRTQDLAWRWLAGGWVRRFALYAHTRRILQRFGVQAEGPHTVARALSGGNLQKFIVGREIEAQPRVLLLAQPTWGVDVGAAAHIHREIMALRAAGCAIVVVSEEIEELFAICDRLQVQARGRLSPALPIAQAQPEQLGAWMAGLWDQTAHGPAGHQ